MLRDCESDDLISGSVFLSNKTESAENSKIKTRQSLFVFVAVVVFSYSGETQETEQSERWTTGVKLATTAGWLSCLKYLCKFKCISFFTSTFTASSPLPIKLTSASLKIILKVMEIEMIHFSI